MVMSDHDLDEIYTHALPFNEVIKAQWQPCATKKQVIGGNDKKSHWSSIVARGDLTAFHNRFEWCGIDPECINNYLTESGITGNKNKASWCDILKRCVESCLDKDAQLTVSRNKMITDESFPIPFQEILITFVHSARQLLLDKIGGSNNLPDNIIAVLERSLLFWLARLNTMSMTHDFTVFRHSLRGGLSKSLKEKKSPAEIEDYKKYLSYLLNGGLVSFFKEYSVLARLASTSIEQWIKSVTLLNTRISTDRNLLASAFNGGRDLGDVVGVSTFLSDRHNNGQSVLILRFATGVKVVYKPKPLGIEKCFNSFLNYLKTIGCPICFKTYSTIDCSDYGWAEFVPDHPATDENSRERYYRNAGGLLCVTYLLGATDLHFENLVSSGEHPVLIDLETILHPYARKTDYVEKENAYSLANHLLTDSVLRTSLLPRWSINKLNQSYDASGLGKVVDDNFRIRTIAWENINTDTMQVRKKPVPVSPPHGDTDMPGQSDCSLKNYEQQLITGFESLYGFFINNKEKILESDSWRNFKGQQVRFVFRPTQVYAELEENLLYPNLLRRGIDRSIHLDYLYRDSVQGKRPPSWWLLIQAEQSAMESLDIPHFAAFTDSRHIVVNRSVAISDYFTEPSFETACRRIASANHENMSRQVQLIKGSLECSRAIHEHDTPRRLRIKVTANDKLSKKRSLLQTTIMAKNIWKQSIRAKDGSVTWIAPQPLGRSDKFQMEPLSYDLYDGNCGIALFFGALFHITGQQQYRQWALDCMQLPVDYIRQVTKNAMPVQQVGGACEGIASLLYTLNKLALFVGTSVLTDVANECRRLITTATIEGNNSNDVVNGNAGLILSLLSGTDINADQESLQLAQAAGDNLVNKQTRVSGRLFPAWPGRNGVSLAGFSHGAAGIAYALLRLYKVCKKDKYLIAALDGIRYEQELFDPDVVNWPDLRQSGQHSSFMCSWCHGAAGIGLARVAALDVLDNELIRKDIGHVLETTKKYLDADADHLCCGNFGRLEFLLSAGVEMGNKEIIKIAKTSAEALIRRAEVLHGFQYNFNSGLNVGFFQGTCGIAYEILRLSFPEDIPSILAFN
jgi:type 2 lantibiotic biosynthesis protein LanM